MSEEELAKAEADEARRLALTTAQAQVTAAYDAITISFEKYNHVLTEQERAWITEAERRLLSAWVSIDKRR